MTYPPGWSGQHPPSSANSPPVDLGAMNGHALPWLVGRLLDGQDRATASLARIEQRLEHGTDRMDDHEGRLEALEQRPASPPSPSPPADQPSRIERLIVRWLAYIIPAAVAWETGSIKAGLEALRAALK